MLADQDRAGHKISTSTRPTPTAEDWLHLRPGFNIVGSAVRDGRRLIAVAPASAAPTWGEFIVCLLDEAFLLKTGGNRPRSGNRATVMDWERCSPAANAAASATTCRAMLPGWHHATGRRRGTPSTPQAELARPGFNRLGKDICRHRQ
jgi:hypothetical protein